MAARRAWERKSGEVSITTLRFLSSSQTDERNRRSRGSVEEQTRHWQASMGTPWEVPVPRKVRCIKKSGGEAIFGRVGYASFGIGVVKIFPRM